MENNETCKKECPVKSCLCKLVCYALPVFVILMAGGFLVHHVWLMPIYQATPQLWRPASDMGQYFPWMIGFYAILSIVISGLFCKVNRARKAMCETLPESECAIGSRKCPIKYGVCFGILIGLLLGAMAAASYIWTPIPGELAVKWFISWVAEGAVIGGVLGLIGHKKCKKEGACK